MEKHQAGQEEGLVKVKMETDSVEAVHQHRGLPAGRHGCFKYMAALATVMGLVIATLVAGIFLHYSMVTPSCNQDTPPSSDTKVNLTSKLKESDVQGKYDIFTVPKPAPYLIYGWVRLANVTREENSIELIKQLDGDIRIIEKKNVNGEIIFFHSNATMINNMRVTIRHLFNHTDSLFHLYEL